MKKMSLLVWGVSIVSLIGSCISVIMKEYEFGLICIVLWIGSFIVLSRNHSFASHLERIEYEEEQARLEEFWDRNEQDY